MRIIVTLFSLVLFICSCRSLSDDDPLHLALQQAGDNRVELEYVLEYYSKKEKDSLKFEAAKFLIRSMPYYYSLEGQSLDKFKYTFDQAVANGLKGKSALDWTLNAVGSPNLNLLKKQRDIEIIKRDFLIETIEHSFMVWEKQPWGKDVSFDDFCEYILPYRIGNEPLENWKSKYYLRYQPILDSLLTTNNILDASSIIYNYLVQDAWEFILQMPDPHLGADYLFDKRVGSCRDRCDLAIYVMRSLGLPVGTDMVLHNPDQENRHFWNFVIDNKGSTTEFTLWEEPPILKPDRELEKKRGKVYRNDFSIKPRTVELYSKERTVPGLVGKLNLKDVSDQYFATNNVTIFNDGLGGVSEGILYVCVFSTSGWYPIAWGEVSRSVFSIDNLEKGVLYTLCKSVDGILAPVYYPFVVESERGVHYFKPSNATYSISLERKFTMKFMREHMKRFTGGEFHGSNSKDFSQYSLLHRIDTIEIPRFYSVDIDGTGMYRYVRYYSPPQSLCNMAELNFFNTNDDKLNGEVIGSEGSIFNEERLAKHAVFDNDPLTFFNAPDTIGMWVGLDFGTRKNVTRIEFLPRNDDNFIKAGEVYELFYFDNSGWKSLGKKEGGSTQILTYKNAPHNAIFWLRNLSRGKEERLFSYEKNRQKWW